MPRAVSHFATRITILPKCPALSRPAPMGNLYNGAMLDMRPSGTIIRLTWMFLGLLGRPILTDQTTTPAGKEVVNPCKT